MKRLLLLLAFCFITSAMFAQYGWTPAVVTLKDGTILEGEATLNMMYQGVNFGKEKLRYRKSKTAKGKNAKYAPEAVEQIMFTVTYKEKVGKRKVEKTRKEKYVPVYLNKNLTKLGFVQLIVDGNLKLVGRTVAVNNAGAGTWTNTGGPGSVPVFQPGLGYFGSHNQIMLLKSGDKPEVFNQTSLTKSFRKRGMKYFKDCPALVSKIENRSLKKEDLKAIVNFYNTSCN